MVIWVTVYEYVVAYVLGIVVVVFEETKFGVVGVVGVEVHKVI